MDFQNTKESIITLTVPAGAQSAEIDFKPTVDGRVISAVIYKDSADNKGNTGFVNAGIKDSDGVFVSNMQHIDNYRSRDCAYHEGGKPLNFETNKRSFTFMVVATQPFQEDFKAQLIFIFEDEREKYCQ